MQKKTTIYQRLTEEGADPALLEQYRRYQETGNTQGQCGLICRFRREKMKEIIFQGIDMVKHFHLSLSGKVGDAAVVLDGVSQYEKYCDIFVTFSCYPISERK